VKRKICGHAHDNLRIFLGVRGSYAWAFPVVSFMLASCSGASKADEAEKRLEMVERVGTLGEACEAARAVSNAYLEAGDEEKYRFAHVSAAIKCQSADLIGTHLPAQEKLRNQVEAEVREIEREIDSAAKSVMEADAGS
jgi:hypothetical protein